MRPNRIVALGAALACTALLSAVPTHAHDGSPSAEDATAPTPTTLWRGPGTTTPSSWSGTAEAGLVNGDFADGLDAWSAAESGGGSAPGAVLGVDGEARLFEGDSFLVSLAQSFVLPAGTTSLSFDVLQVPGFDLTDNFLPDAFEATLLTEGGFPAVDPWAPFATSFFNLQEDGSTNLGSGTTFDGTRVSVLVDAVPAGETLTLVFDMIGADGDTAGGLAVDTVTLDFECDVPASWSHYGSAFPGANGAPVLTPLSTRAIGATYDIDITNPTGALTSAIGFIGLTPAATPTPLGGVLLLDPVTIVAFDLPPAGKVVPHTNDPDIALCGLAVYAQVIIADATAPGGYTFSEGLEIIIGSP